MVLWLNLIEWHLTGLDVLFHRHVIFILIRRKFRLRLIRRYCSGVGIPLAGRWYILRVRGLDACDSMLRFKIHQRHRRDASCFVDILVLLYILLRSFSIAIIHGAFSVWKIFHLSWNVVHFSGNFSHSACMGFFSAVCDITSWC